MLANLPNPLDDVLAPLFSALPLDRAMNALVVRGGGGTHTDLVEKIVKHPAIQARPELAAGLWLYVDDLDRSHTISQGIETPTGSFWHAIMHRREGDFSNSKYWYRRVGHHPAMSAIEVAGGGAAAGTDVGGYDPFGFVDRVQRCVEREGGRCVDLEALQRREWAALFEWCATT